MSGTDHFSRASYIPGRKDAIGYKRDDDEAKDVRGALCDW